MNFRQLIEKAMHEAREEFAEIITRKLAALMGTESGLATAVSTRTARVDATAKASPKKRSKKGRVAPDHMSNVQEKILHVMSSGAAMKKGEMMKAARLLADDGPRVSVLLAKLKDAGVLSMKGQRGSAVYTLKG